MSFVDLCFFKGDPLSHLALDAEVDVDLFAGGGGTSTGYEQAMGKSPDLAINHDMEALTMHMANHPYTMHICQNIINVEPLRATGGRLVRDLWASPDCTHFSKAKGGKPRDQFIRDLAWTVIRWAELTRPKRINLENVEEFQTWGPLDENGKPIPSKKGETFRAWVAALRKFGYSVAWRELRACDYGAPTTRKRLFISARLDGKTIKWPKPTHGAPNNPLVKKGKLKPWRVAAECIDWSDRAPSIFERKKPLVENTLRRIAEGMRRYVLTAKNPFVVTYYGSKSPNEFRGFGIDEPLRTQTTENRFGLVSPLLISANHTADYYKYFRGQSVSDPLGTITQAPGFALCSPYLVTPNHSGDNFRGQSITDPVGTMTGKGSFCLTTPYLVQPNHSTAEHFHGQGIEEPAKTITGKATHALVTPHLINIDHKGPKGEFRASSREVSAPLSTVTQENRHALIGATLIQTGYGEREGQAPRVPGLGKPLGTVMAGGVKHALTTASFAVKMRGTNVGSPVDTPLHTISAQGQHHSLVSASFIKYYSEGGQHAGLDEPMHTSTSKARFALQAAHLQQYNECLISQSVSENTGHYEEVRAFLRHYGVIGPDEEAEVLISGIVYRIMDIGLRMLRPRELFNANGFPPDYKITPVYKGKPLGVTSQVKKCGNSVPPPPARAILSENKNALLFRRNQYHHTLPLLMGQPVEHTIAC